MSTWGSISQAGLTELQVFDEEGQKIELKPSGFHLRNCGLTSIKNISRIIDGVIYTTEEDHMCVYSMPAPPATPEISITLKTMKGVGGIRIWNYNKSLIESVKGIKELEIIQNKNVIWFGVVNRAPGNESEPYHTEVIIKKGLVLPKVELPDVTNLGLGADQLEAGYVSSGRPSVEQNEYASNKEVPSWLQDALPRGNLAAASFDNKGPTGNMSRREYERSAPSLNINKVGVEPGRSLMDRVQVPGPELKLENVGKRQPKTEIPESTRISETDRDKDSETRTGTAGKVRSHPKVSSPFMDILDDKPLAYY